MEIVKNITLADATAWEEVTFERKASEFLVKNFTEGDLLVSFIEDDEGGVFTIPAGGKEKVFVAKNIPFYTLYVKGEGNIEVRELDATFIEPLGNVNLTLAPMTGTVLGEAVADLQEDVEVQVDAKSYMDVIKGTLKYVTGFTGYSSDPELQDGNFLAVKATWTNGAKAVAEVVGGTAGAKELDDGEIVIRVVDTTKYLKIVVTKLNTTKTYNFSFSGLVLEEPEEEVQAEA